MFVSENNLKILREVLDEYTKQASESLSVPAEIENYQFSKRFENFMQRLIRRQRKSYYRFIDTTAKRVASYAIILLICAVVTVFSVKALRDPFINFVVKTYEKFTSIFVQKDDIAAANADVDFEIMLPTYIPEGYELVEKEEHENAVKHIYKNFQNSYLTYVQKSSVDWHFHANTENIKYENININSTKGIFYQNNEKSCVILLDTKCVFVLEGYLTKEEIINIAKSIK